MTPLAIKTLMTIYYSADQNLILNAEGFRQLFDAELIEFSEERQLTPHIVRQDVKLRDITLTDRGHAMVYFLTRLPLPEKKTTWQCGTMTYEKDKEKQ